MFSACLLILFYPQIYTLTKDWLVVNRKYGKFCLSCEVFDLCSVPLAVFLGSTILWFSPFWGEPVCPSLFCVLGFSPVTGNLCTQKSVRDGCRARIAALVLERTCPIAEVDSKRSPVISTPHHLAFHDLVASYKIYVPILFLFCSQAFLFQWKWEICCSCPP